MHGLHVKVNAEGVATRVSPHPYPAQRTFRTPGTGGEPSDPGGSRSVRFSYA